MTSILVRDRLARLWWAGWIALHGDIAIRALALIQKIIVGILAWIGLVSVMLLLSSGLMY